MFLQTYFLNENVSHNIYQGMVDVTAQCNINTWDLKEGISPIKPQVQTPSKVDHEAM